jgi:hypothetical protein
MKATARPYGTVVVSRLAACATVSPIADDLGIVRLSPVAASVHRFRWRISQDQCDAWSSYEVHVIHGLLLSIRILKRQPKRIPYCTVADHESPVPLAVEEQVSAGTSQANAQTTFHARQSISKMGHLVLPNKPTHKFRTGMHCEKRLFPHLRTLSACNILPSLMMCTATVRMNRLNYFL